MRYLPTPLNITSLVLLISAIYTACSDQPFGDGLTKFWVFPAVGLALLFLLVDFFIQRFLSKYKSIFIIECAIVGVILSIPRIIGYMNRTDTLILSPSAEKPYCVMIYDVENAKDVFKNGNCYIPPSGIVFNAQKQSEKQRSVLLSGENVVGHSYFNDQLICNHKTFNYKAWFLVVDKNRTYDEDSLKLEIKQYLQTQCDVIDSMESNDPIKGWVK